MRLCSVKGVVVTKFVHTRIIHVRIPESQATTTHTQLPEDSPGHGRTVVVRATGRQNSLRTFVHTETPRNLSYPRATSLDQTKVPRSVALFVLFLLSMSRVCQSKTICCHGLIRLFFSRRRPSGVLTPPVTDGGDASNRHPTHFSRLQATSTPRAA